MAALGRSALVWVMGTGVFVGCASLAGCGSARHKPDEPVVKGLRITGNHQLSSGKIEGKILTHATGWWPFAAKQLFDPVAWQTDLKRIVRFYGSRGYYQAEIARNDVTPKPPDGVALTVEVKEGPPTRVGALDIQGMEGLPPEDREAALEKLPVAVGKTFVETDWATAKEGLRTRLRNRGYAKATVAGVALVDAATQTATLRIAIAPGRRYQFGEVQVATDPGTRIPASPIWEQARVAVPEGRVYSDEAVEGARERLVAMGVFSSVVVRPGTPDEATGRIPVVVRVHEAAFHTLRLGAGVRVDPVRNEVRGISEWTHRDFLGGLRRLTARAEAGWAFMPSLIAVPNANQAAEPRRDGPIGRLALELQQPRFLGRPTLTERTILVGDHSLEQTYTSTGASITTGVVWQPWLRLAFAFSYTLETDYLTGPPVAGAASAPLTLGCQTTTNQCWVWLSYLSQTVTWDRRDNRLEPRNGTYLSFGAARRGRPAGRQLRIPARPARGTGVRLVRR